SLDEANLNVAGVVGGEIGIQALDVEMRDSVLRGGIAEGLGIEGGQSGNIELDAMGDITISDGFVANLVREGSIGNAGDINLSADNIELNNGAQLDSSTLGEGNTGSVTLRAGDSIVISGANSDDFPSAVFNQVTKTGQGNAGNVSLIGEVIEISEGALLSSSTFGEGDGGSVTIEAGDTARFLNGNVFSNVEETGRGDAGNIRVIGNRVEVLDGAQLISNTFGLGNSGRIDIQGTEAIIFSGEKAEGFPSGVFSRVLETGQGNAGEINLFGNSIELSNQVLFSTSSFGEGDAGNITIEASNVVQILNSYVFSSVEETGRGNAGNIRVIGNQVGLRDGTWLVANTSGHGNAGQININGSDTIIFSGENSEGVASAAFSSVRGSGQGNAGEINLLANYIEVRDRAQLSSSTFGEGDAGNVTIEASETVRVLNGAVFSRVEETGRGDGGNIRIIGNRIEVQDGAQLSSSTSHQGNAGNIDIQGTEAIIFSGENTESLPSAAFSNVRGSGQGNAGEVILRGNYVEVSNGAELSSSTLGEGNAGNVTIEASDTVRFSNGTVFSEVAERGRGNAGNIRVTGNRVEVLEGAQLSSSTSGEGNAGRIDIQGAEAIIFSGEDSEGFRSAAFSTVGESGQGNPGEINLFGNSIEVRDRAQLSSSTFGEGDAGNVTIEASDTVRFLNNATVFSDVETTGQGDGGSIRVIGNRVEVLEGAQLVSNTRGQGNAGSIDIQGTEVIIFSGENAEGLPSGAFSRVRETGQGNAGTIRLRGNYVEVRNRAQLSSSTFGEGDAGDVTIEASNTARFLNGTVFSNVEETGQGNAGNIRVIGNRVEVLDGSQFNSSTFGQGNAGGINIQGTEAIIFSGENAEGLPSAAFSILRETGQGNAGEVNLVGNFIEIRDQALLSSSTFGEGDGGNITIEASEIVQFSNANVFSSVTETGRGNAGNIRIIGDRVELRDGVSLFSSTLGQGNAGSVTIEASDTAQLSNANVFSTVEERAKGNGGDIQIITNTLFLEDGAQLNVNTLGEGNAGTIIVQAHDRVILSGVNSDGLGSRISSVVAESGRGNAGGVRISADSLEMRDGAQLNASTLGQGNAGTLAIEVSDTVLFSSSFALSLVGENAQGNAGGISIVSNSLEVRDGAQLNSSTAGQGNAGTITVEANDQVIFSGVNPEGLPSGGASTSVGNTGQGDAGDVRIVANTLELRDGAILDSSTAGQGNAGTVSIEVSESFWLSNGFVASGVGNTGHGNAGNVIVVADRLEVHDGVLISSSFNEGDAGTVTVEVHDTAIFSGSYTDFSGVEPEDFPGGLSSTIEETGQGNAGGVNLIAGTVELRDRARLSSSNNTTSNANDFTAGDVFVQADRLHLSDRADISANTGGRGGNIRLDTGTTILRRGSTIQTNAEGDFPGGNIIIDTDALVALENSDITANAINAAGGRVIINTQGIFGTEFRDELTPQSDITASSDLGAEFSGSVELNTPDVDTATGLVDLSANPVDVAAILDTDPCTGGRESEFYVTG
ncbi:S-layer family protein, partial [Geitlerinema sp. P-1104]|uniref:beta strand repeat-containing protein n=1 Tax=Geitlerinema sp. P-1104 TaxID=2546230 RepID=UPI0014772562